MHVLADDLAFPEGPVRLPDGSWLVTELDPARGQVTALAPEGEHRRVLARTGRPNGLCLGADQVVWVAESREPSLLRLRLDGTFDAVLGEVEGVSLLWPNDLCFGPDGWIYLTDSGLRVGDLLTPDGGVRDDFWALDYRGIIARYDPRSGVAEILDSGLRFTNGIAFGPDGMLYASESVTGNVYRYDLAGDRRRQEFANVIEQDGPRVGWHGPDGMCFSDDGRLWVTVFGQAHVAVVDRNGGIADRLRLEGSGPTNVAFGPPGSHRLYVVETELGRMEAHDVAAEGLPLHG